MKSLYEQMCGTYHQEDNYLIPSLLQTEGSDTPLGKYGCLRRTLDEIIEGDRLYSET